jgi:hypothetical protein
MKEAWFLLILWSGPDSGGYYSPNGHAVISNQRSYQTEAVCEAAIPNVKISREATGVAGLICIKGFIR